MQEVKHRAAELRAGPVDPLDVEKISSEGLAKLRRPVRDLGPGRMVRCVLEPEGAAARQAELA